LQILSSVEKIYRLRAKKLLKEFDFFDIIIAIKGGDENLKMDKFLEWLGKNKEHYALVDTSYKMVYQRESKSPTANDIRVNTELATYGDAVLKLALCQILWDKDISQLTEIKKKYEEDENLVKIIAKHYDLLKFIKYDNSKKPNDYNYNKSKNRNTHKFIATAVEACLGAIYHEEKDINIVLGIVKDWIDMVDKQDNN